MLRVLDKVEGIRQHRVFTGETVMQRRFHQMIGDNAVRALDAIGANKPGGRAEIGQLRFGQNGRRKYAAAGSEGSRFRPDSLACT